MRSQNRATCFGYSLIKILRVEWWQELVFSRVEIAKDSWCSCSTASGSPVKTRYESQQARSSWNEQHLGQEDLFWTLTHQDTQSGILTIFLLSDRLQLTAVCCNRRGVWTALLTRHIFSVLHNTHTLVSSRKFGVSTSHVMRHLHALMLCVWFSSTSPLFSLFCLSSLLSSFSSFWPSTSSSTMWWTNSLCIVRLSHRLRSQRLPHLRDHWTIHPGILRREQIMNSHDIEYDDCTIGIALSSPLFTQEREDDASRRRPYHFQDEGLSSSQSVSVGHRAGRTVVEQFDSQISNVTDSAPQLRKWANQDSFWNDRENRFSLN